jgi:hypothetical protein
LANYQPLITASDADLEDLRAAVTRTCWPTPWPIGGWQAGVDTGELRRLVEYWAAPRFPSGRPRSAASPVKARCRWFLPMRTSWLRWDRDMAGRVERADQRSSRCDIAGTGARRPPIEAANTPG